MPTIYAHFLIVKTAQDMAHELYSDIMSGDNALYADWKRQCEDLTPELAEEMFVQMMYPKLLEPARATLATMLGQAHYAHLHEAIYDALTKDYALRHGRRADRRRARLEIEDGQVTKVTRTRH
jgi:hypothetical protein